MMQHMSPGPPLYSFESSGSVLGGGAELREERRHLSGMEGGGGEDAEEDNDDILAISEPAYYAGYIWVSYRYALDFSPLCSLAPLNI